MLVRGSPGQPVSAALAAEQRQQQRSSKPSSPAPEPRRLSDTWAVPAASLPPLPQLTAASVPQRLALLPALPGGLLSARGSLHDSMLSLAPGGQSAATGGGSSGAVAAALRAVPSPPLGGGGLGDTVTAAAASLTLAPQTVPAAALPPLAGAAATASVQPAAAQQAVISMLAVKPRGMHQRKRAPRTEPLSQYNNAPAAVPAQEPQTATAATQQRQRRAKAPAGWPPLPAQALSANKGFPGTASLQALAESAAAAESQPQPQAQLSARQSQDARIGGFLSSLSSRGAAPWQGADAVAVALSPSPIAAADAGGCSGWQVMTGLEKSPHACGSEALAAAEKAAAAPALCHGGPALEKPQRPRGRYEAPPMHLPCDVGVKSLPAQARSRFAACQFKSLHVRTLLCQSSLAHLRVCEVSIIVLCLEMLGSKPMRSAHQVCETRSADAHTARLQAPCSIAATFLCMHTTHKAGYIRSRERSLWCHSSSRALRGRASACCRPRNPMHRRVPWRQPRQRRRLRAAVLAERAAQQKWTPIPGRPRAMTESRAIECVWAVT